MEKEKYPSSRNMLVDSKKQVMLAQEALERVFECDSHSSKRQHQLPDVTWLMMEFDKWLERHIYLEVSLP